MNEDRKFYCIHNYLHFYQELMLNRAVCYISITMERILYIVIIIN